MKRGKSGEQTEKREHGLWHSMLAVFLPVFALALSAVFVLVCFGYSRIRPVVSIELGADTPDAKAFLRNETDRASYLIAPEAIYRSPGEYRLAIRVNGQNYPVRLMVADTQAPAADGTETTISTRMHPTPDRLIRNLRDQSIVKLTFETAPEYGKIGDYDAVVLLEDESGNASRVPVTVHVRAAVDAITAEAGDPAPDPDAFLIDSYENVRMTEITEEMLTTPGEYTIRITADGVETESRLIVKDTVPPAGNGVMRIAAPDETILPETMVAGVSDKTRVSAAFVAPPDPDSRAQQIIGIRLTDLGGNETTVYSTLLITSAKPVEIEARKTPVNASEILEGGMYAEAGMSIYFVPDEPGMHVIGVMVDGKENIALINVKDTTPPEIGIYATSGFQNDPLPPEAFAAATDVTETELRYREEPDWTKAKQDVTITATDASGNTAERTFVLTLEKDTVPPELYGVRERYCYVGETVEYLAEVSARDNCDGEIKVKVNASKVDPTQAGDYTVVFSAKDRAGNSVRKSAVFHFIKAKVSDARAQEVADEILSQILTDDMTLAEQIEAIYEYVFRNVRYSFRSNKQDWRAEAVRGLTTGRGDCFTSYASARLLLEQTDAQILSVERQNKTAHHYWMLVNIGTGWYHFDACRAWNGKYHVFMWTDAQLQRVSKTYWKYDKSLYPPVATERYDGGN